MTTALAVLRRPLIAGAVAVVACVGTARAQKPAAPDLRSFDAYAAKAMTNWKVPGTAIAIVRNDSIVFAKGYGRIGCSASRWSRSWWMAPPRSHR